MSLREDLQTIIAGANDWRDECLARDVRYFLRYHGQALIEAVEENEKLWELVCWNIDNFRDLPLTDGYYAKWLGRAETLLSVRSKTNAREGA